MHLSQVTEGGIEVKRTLAPVTGNTESGVAEKHTCTCHSLHLSPATEGVVEEKLTRAPVTGNTEGGVEEKRTLCTCHR